ncbi:glycoside hydrolase family 16 protein [Pseudarthrobacter sp. Y6]|uniref:glycoside hydrolase family 16 protein n=1 Tax=Pseudarthrobacter sp. Y6 TaxID=3418422 RepID=UPI003CF6008D
MSASPDQPRSDARPYSEEAAAPTRRRSALKKSADRAKTRRTMSLTAAALVALLGVVSLGQVTEQAPQSAELSRVADTSSRAQAPGQVKRNTSPAPAPLPATDPSTEPTTAPAPAPEAPAVAPAPAPVTTTTAAPAPAPALAPLASSGTTGTMPVGVPGAWTMAFADEFNGTALDTAKWSNCWFSPSCGSMNKVATSPGNVSVGGGNLALSLNSSTSGALVSTNPKGGAGTGYEFTTGYVEARIKFPGDGTNLYNWPAFWTNGQSWPTNGENDIAEVLSGKMTVNYHSTSGAHNQGTVPGDWGNNFHTFGLHRTANSADVYFDGVKVKSYSTDDGGAPQYIVLNVGASGSSPAAYGAASQVQVDYVRAWK